ncbi:MAG: hypothetical protein J0H99_21635, partial [Rhodospirillales bacterium]|nr:hypothetical protein [Rhodospirillales bacterium]
MSLHPAAAGSTGRPPADPPGEGRRAGSHLLTAATARIRRAPTPRGLARRRLMITLTKWLLPLAALG